MKTKRYRHLAGWIVATVVLAGVAQASSAQNFPFAFFRILSRSQGERNFLYSPYSVSRAFLLAELGARGETRQQIGKTIDLSATIAPPSEGENAPALWVANRIWLGQGVKILPSYLKSCEEEAKATPGVVDFAAHPEQAADTINSWVQTQTHGKITKLIPPGSLNGRTRLILANAVYFKGPWENPFKKELTHDGDFHLASGKKAKLPFMHEHTRYAYHQGKLAQAIELRYHGGEFAMLIVLPQKGVALSRLESELSVGRLEKWESTMNYTDVVLSLPRFKFSSDFVLNAPLRAGGIRLPFDPDHADFSGIDGAKDLYIAKVFHKAFIAVDEAGTEAAAATAIEMRMRAILHAGKPAIMNVDHPFVFLIQDLRSKAVLFMGRVMNPRG